MVTEIQADPEVAFRKLPNKEFPEVAFRKLPNKEFFMFYFIASKSD